MRDKPVLRLMRAAAITVLLGMILISITKEVKADSVLLGGVSHHLYSDDVDNNWHRAVIYQRGDFAFGYLKNSHSNDSFMATYKVWEDIDKDITTDINLGAVRGYERCYGDFKPDDTKRNKVIACPLVLINVTIRTDTMIKPVLSLWGDAVVLTGKVDF